MNIQKAFQRLSWRLSNGTFTPNQNDADALKFIALWVNKSKEEKVFENRHFAKIVVAYYIDLLIYYKWDVIQAEQAIQEVLQSNTQIWYEKFTAHMNTVSWVNTSDVLGLVDEWEVTRPENGKRRDWNKFFELKKKNKNILQESGEDVIKSAQPYTVEQITKKLNNFISELVNEYSNKP